MNEELARLGPYAQLFFIGLWQCSDKEGRLEDRPARLHAAIFPYYPEVDVEKILHGLADSGFIVRYEVGRRRLIWVITFRKHQRIHGTEAEMQSHLPAPPAPPEESEPPPPPAAPSPPELPAGAVITTEAIYDAYPRRVGKPAALRAIAVACGKVTPMVLLERTRAYAAAVNGQNPRFIPHPSKWFEQERYNDDPSTWERHEDGGATDSPGARVDQFTAGEADLYVQHGREQTIDNPPGLPPVPPELLVDPPVGTEPPPDA